MYLKSFCNSCSQIYLDRDFPSCLYYVSWHESTSWHRKEFKLSYKAEEFFDSKIEEFKQLEDRLKKR